MKRLILVPAIITLGVTFLRLIGELNGWSPALFNPAAGGGFALVGIWWLAPVFGAYFALKLSGSGVHVSAGRTIAFAVLALASFLVVAFGLGALLGVDPNVPTVQSFLTIIVGSLVALAVVYKGTPELSKVLLAYALAARIPVVAVMFFAILGSWGTHYDVAPPGFPQVGAVSKWFQIGLVPQLTIWIAYTLVAGAFVGGVALALARRKPALQTA